MRTVGGKPQMKKLYYILIGVILFSCSQQDNSAKCDFPEIVVEPENDTVRIGETYRAKISLSDTSLLYFYDGPNDRRVRTVPIFSINGELVDSNKDYYIYETVVDSSDITVQKDGDKFKEWSVGLVFPHPSGFGDVKLSQRNSYLIKN